MSSYAQTSPPTTTADDPAKTEYVVLRHVDYGDPGGYGWSEVKTITARSADDAIRKAAGEEADRYVAIPKRSFVPRTLSVKTERRAVLT